MTFRYQLRRTLCPQGRRSNEVIIETEFFALAAAGLQPGENIIDLRNPTKEYHWLGDGTLLGWVHLQ